MTADYRRDCNGGDTLFDFAEYAHLWVFAKPAGLIGPQSS